MDSELLTTCSALGYLEENQYYKEPDCIDTVKCLIKYLHNENSTRDIRTQLGAANVLQNDLIPIMSQFPSDNDLFQTVLRLTVNMTQPTLLCFGGKVPKDTVMHHHFLDVMSHNQSYKEAFGDNEKIWKVFAEKIYDVLETDWEDRRPEDGLLVERILVLIRNLLHVPVTIEDTKKTSDDLSTHDRLLWQMHVAGIDALLLYIAGSSTEQEWSLHIIEIICLFLKEQTAECLAKTGARQTEVERKKEGDELEKLRKIEEAKKQQARAKMTPWHSRFGGTYVMRGTKAIADDRDVILHRSVRQCDKISFDDGKTKLRKARNRRALVDDVTSRRSTLNIRNMLKEFCNGLLGNAYNVLMHSIKDKLSREKAQDHDETYYFWAMSFFLEFNRLSSFRIELVSETMQLGTLHYLDTQMINYYELMLNDKQDAQAWGRRMHLALRCYHEFLMTVYVMENSNSHALKESSRVLQNNLFYIIEYREIFLTLLRKFDERKQTRRFLRDLIKTVHLFLKMFESYCKDTSIVVQKKVRGKSKNAKKKKKQPATSTPAQPNEEERARIWGEIHVTVSELLQETSSESTDFNSVDVFDPAAEASEETQQHQTIAKIQNFLLQRDHKAAIKMLRTARHIWPERNIFGVPDISTEQELTVLHEICLADLSDVLNASPDVVEEEDAEVEEDEDEERLPQKIKEVEFSFNEYLKKFADAKIVKPYVTLLKEFEQNGPTINHCITKMLHRVAYDLKMYGLLFQVTLLHIFQKIFVAVNTDKSLKELAALAKWIMVKIYEVSLANKHLFTDMLFWKNSAAEVYELTEGYGSFSSSSGFRNQVVWSEEEKMELLDLYNQYKDSGSDLVDGIMSSITNETRSRRQICQQLVKQGLVESLADLKRTKGLKTVIWRDDDVEELKRLYEEFSSSADPIGNIIQMMSNKKSKKKVVEKLLSLNLVSDRKQLYKKRARKPKTNRAAEVVHFGGESDSEGDVHDESEEEEDSSEDESIDLRQRQKMLIESCYADDFVEELLWIRRSMEGALSDRKDTDDIQPIPIVPLTESQENAMANRNFKKLLKTFQIQPPSNEQEMFWRIPSTMNATALAAAVDLLTNHKRKREESPKLQLDSDDEEDVTSPVEKRRRQALIDDDEEDEDL
ncbi:protein timeless homolog [Clavelina lepadiformis]|uniref:protein timeless homolog n=1 Tax=Clavelina lepadiformis TaxID=159417 RepID=UPI00404286C5